MSTSLDTVSSVFSGSDVKWLRNYRIIIKTPDDDSIVIEPPFSCEIEVTRDMKAAMNNCTVNLYNLSISNRNLIYKDPYSFTLDWEMGIYAGYGTTMYEIFLGNITEAYSYKSNTEWITKIIAYDGSFQIQNGFIAESFTSGSSLSNIIIKLINAMPNLGVGAIGSSISGSLGRGFIALGNPYENIQILSGNKAFIDAETLNILANNEILTGDVFEIDSNRILETPRRRDTYLEVTTLFSPEIKIARIVELNSEFTKFNGQYKIWGIKHNFVYRGDSVGNATTKLSLNVGAKVYTKVSK